MSMIRLFTHRLLSIALLLAVLSAAACAASPPTESPAPATLTAPPPAPSSSPTSSPTLAPTAAPTGTPSPVPTPQPTARRGEFITIFCLSVTQRIEGSSSLPGQPIEAVLGRILSGAGLTFITGADYCDAVLHFDLTFTPVRYEYQVQGSSPVPCYSGVVLTGTAVLTFEEKTLYQRELLAEHTPSGSASECPTLETAPFEQVWPQPALLALIEIWGKHVLVPAFSDPDPAVRTAAAENLAVLGRQEILSILPFLTTILEGSAPAVQVRLLEALHCCVDDESVAALVPRLENLLTQTTDPQAASEIHRLLDAIAP